MMLFDGAVRFIEQARTALTAKDFEQTYINVSKAQKIVTELIGNLKHDKSPDLCDKLTAVYKYVYKKLFEGSARQNIAALDEAVKMMNFQRETWMMLMLDLGKQKASEAASKMTMPAPSARMERSISMSA